MELNKIYFYTASILNWQNLLFKDAYKDIIIDSLKYLISLNKILVYGFVIMPNHIHLIWEMIDFNGKELPHASFMKFTSHEIKKDLSLNDPFQLGMYRVDSNSRNYQFWQRDSLPIHVYSPNVIYQKLEYLHNNPVQNKWSLVSSPIEYKYSSANFYETNNDTFGILTHIGNRT